MFRYWSILPRSELPVGGAYKRPGFLNTSETTADVLHLSVGLIVVVEVEPSSKRDVPWHRFRLQVNLYRRFRLVRGRAPSFA